LHCITSKAPGELKEHGISPRSSTRPPRRASFSRLPFQVTSPGGTTIAGVEALENGGFRAAAMGAVVAAAARSKELAKAS
jgi:pyrroline-5-carboxylate reductase